MSSGGIRISRILLNGISLQVGCNGKVICINRYNGKGTTSMIPYPKQNATKKEQHMSNTIYHSHHIIPRHQGGTDDPSNLVKLTVAQHAEAHRKLFEEHGDIRDKLAYQGLLGIIGKEEIVFELSRVAKDTLWYHNPENTTEQKMIKPNGDIPDGWIKGRGYTTKSNRDYKKVSDISKAKQAKSIGKAWADKPLHGNAHLEIEIDNVIYSSTKEARDMLDRSSVSINKWVKQNEGSRYGVKMPKGRWTK